MDFLTAIPPAEPENYDANLVITCRLSKAIKPIPSHGTADAKLTAQSFAQVALPNIGLSGMFISNQDTKFTSMFWKSLHAILQVQLSMTTAHHPQADGLVKRVIGTLSEALRIYYGFDHSFDVKELTIDWITVNPTLEYAYNWRKHKVTKMGSLLLK